MDDTHKPTPSLHTIPVHRYGTDGPWVVALHGGPGARGNAAPIAQSLADRFGVLEPWQRLRRDEPLTVAQHLEDLHVVIEQCCDAERPAMVGESWGAMLALAYAAAHPDSAGPLVLIGCGTFCKRARVQLQQTLDERTDDTLRDQLAQLAERYPDPADRLRETYRLITTLYDFDPLPCDADAKAVMAGFDLPGHQDTWSDMLRLQDEGVYPQAFRAIRQPVLMLHGDYDPHPGPMIYDHLKQYIPQLEYHALVQCGHSPWREKTAREPFFNALRDWLDLHLKDI